MKSDTTLKGPRCTNSTRSTSDKFAGQRAGSTGCALGVVIVASVPVVYLIDGPGDLLGAAVSVEMLLLLEGPDDVLTNFSIDPVMVRNPDKKSIIQAD